MTTVAPDSLAPAAAHPHPRPYDNAVQTIGWTPLIRLSRIGAGIRTPIYGKAEYANPGGSVKDRIGLAIIEDAERRGDLMPGGTIVEGTSGNTGVGLAIAAALKGYRCIFTMPDKMSQEKVRLLKAYGAEVVITPTAVPPDHPDNYVMKAKQIVAETPGAILANQFYNQVNPEAHYRTTGPEIWEQTGGRVTHYVAGAGTGGTVSGAGKYLKERNPAVRVVAGDPVGSLYAGYAQSRTLGTPYPYKVEGIGGDKIPSTIWYDVIDEWRSVPDRAAMMMARRCAREEGILLGGSAGLNVALALEIARELDDPMACVVTILCDTGERYLSKVFNDDWMQENQLLDKPVSTVEQLLDRRRHKGSPALVQVAPAAAVRQALNLMGTWEVSQIPVIDEGRCVGALVEQALMTKALQQPSLLDRPVREVMEPPFPIVDASYPTDRLAPMLTRESPAALVQKDGTLVGIVSRYDVLQELIGTR
ncbi:MAG: pyridoxal-phosphate dependent enzyme [Gemmatimonadales bacterium]|nr:pyridoxal-phosphate dependent enzyme [Gemmatimonadales bacterium]